jgi:hypothetical protein
MTSPNPILVRLPPRLDELLNQRRGAQTRAAFLVAAVAKYLGVEATEAAIPKRGRPKKLDSQATEMIPSPETNAVRVPDVAWLRTVRWKDIVEAFPRNGEAGHTLYVAEDGTYVRFAFEERNRSTGKEIVRIIKCNGGQWNPNTGWPIESSSVLEAVKARASHGRPPWDIRPMSDVRPKGWEFVRLNVLDIGSGLALLQLDGKALDEAGRKYPAETNDFVWRWAKEAVVPWFYSPDSRNTFESLPTPAAEANAWAAELKSKHFATVTQTTATPTQRRAWASQPIVATRAIDLVQVRIALANPLHRLILKETAKAIKPGDAFDSEVVVPASAWDAFARDFAAAGGAIDEKRANASRFGARAFDPTAIPGWEQPTPSGKAFYRHQRDDITFLLERQCRALLADEMGLGKTGAAIGAAVAVGAKKIVVIASVGAQGVWDREIRDWAGSPEIIRVDDALQDISRLPAAAWVLVTYDVLTSRAESFAPADAKTAEWLRDQLVEAGHYEKAAVVKRTASAAKSLAQAEGTDKGEGEFTPFRFDARLNPEIGNLLQNLTPPSDQDIDAGVLERLKRIGRRLSSELLRRLSEWDPDIVFVDEAHRIKNGDARRTGAVRALLADSSRGAVLMTGTPLRNHSGEAASLIDAILPGAKKQLAKYLSKGNWRSARKAAADEAVAKILKAVMIRHLKTEAADLPPKIRQWVDIEVADGETRDEYCDLMIAATNKVEEQIANGASRQAAGQAAMGLLTKARRALGLAKIAGPAAADLIDQVVEEKGACIVFAHHRDVIAGMAEQLRALRRTVVVVDGETPAWKRAEAEAAFQDGKVEVFLGSIYAGGEALTLTRADTCVFLELDWVPAAMHQAEDRGHRHGQTAAGYHVIVLMARTLASVGVNLDEEVGRILKDKMAHINAVLDEHATIEGARVKSDEVAVRAQVIEAMLSRRQQT